MHSTFLEELSNFFKAGKVFRGSYDRVYISNKFLPLYLRKEVGERARQINPDAELDDSFILLFDSTGQHLCMLFTFSNGKTNILLRDTENFVAFDKRYTPFDLDEILLEAARKDLRSDLYFASIDGLKTVHSFSDEDARREAAIRVDSIMKSFSDKDIMEGSQISESLERIIPVIEEYALYISELYRTNVEEKDSDVVILPSTIPLMANVIYSQMKSHRVHLDNQERIESIGSKERVNDIIDYIKRKDLLKSLNPMVEGSCLNEEDDEIDYYVYLYRVSATEYKFIFEPLSGKKCTKLFKFKYDKELTVEKIEELAREYLSMSEEDVIACPYAVRFNHTSEETYNAVIPYAITGDSEKYPCPYGTKARINALTYDERALEHKSEL